MAGATGCENVHLFLLAKGRFRYHPLDCKMLWHWWVFLSNDQSGADFCVDINYVLGLRDLRKISVNFSGYLPNELANLEHLLIGTIRQCLSSAVIKQTDCIVLIFFFVCLGAFHTFVEKMFDLLTFSCEKNAFALCPYSQCSCSKKNGKDEVEVLHAYSQTKK